MKISACQVPDIRNDIPRAIAVIQDMTDKAAAQGADIVIFPECFLQGYFADVSSVARLAMVLDSAEFLAILETLKVLSPVIVLGRIEASDEGFRTRYVIVPPSTRLERIAQAL